MDTRHTYYIPSHPDEEEQLENLCIELCVERFMAEGIDLTGWHIGDHPYGDEDVEEYTFVNEDQQLSVDFEIMKDDVFEGRGYVAVAMYNQPIMGGIQMIRTNTVRAAIQPLSDLDECSRPVEE